MSDEQTDEKRDPIKALDRMELNARRLGKAKAERVYLEEFRKTKKALLMRQSDATSAAIQERDAYSHPEYSALLEALKIAVEAEETLRWRMVTDQLVVEVWRSTEASNRAMDRGTR